MKPKKGPKPRPRHTVASHQIQLRVTAARKLAYLSAAQGRPLTQWVFSVLDQSAQYPGHSEAETGLAPRGAGREDK